MGALRWAALILLTACVALGAPERRWDFESPTGDWQAADGLGAVVATEGGNHVLAVQTDRPHHTRLLLRGSEGTPDFVASARFRVERFTGQAPAVYVYGRLAQDGFRFLSVSGAAMSASAWYGFDKPAVGLGNSKVRGTVTAGAWVRVKLACVGDRLWGKAWVDGQPEPGWQLHGRAPGQERGQFALGVWTSPRTPSSATVWFDDITYQSLTAADLPALGLRVAPRPPLSLAGLPAAGPFLRDGLVGLASPRLVLALESGTGCLAHLVDRASGEDFVAAESSLPLASLVLSRPAEGRETSLDSTDFPRRAVRADGTTAVVAEFAGLNNWPLTLRATFAPRADGGIAARCTLTNDSGWALKELTFPRFAMPADLGASDTLVLPWYDGCILPRPGRVSQSRQAEYPGWASLQFTARCGDRAGLYLAAEDASGQCKRWDLRTSAGEDVRLDLTHLQPEVPQRDAGLPYDVVLDTFRGDWRDAADRYRQWAIQQPWCATKLAARADIPAFLKEGSGLIITGIANAQARVARYGERLERLPAEVRAYRERTGLAHVIFVPYGWENRGTWAGINYLPAVPSNEIWAETNRALRAQGDRTAFLLSGYWWVVKRQQTSEGPPFDDTAQYQRQQAMLIHNADGTPFVSDWFDRPKGAGSWRGWSVSLCHGSRAAQDWLAEQFLGAAKLGVPLLSFDQEIGGGQNAPCYDPRHGHPPGHGDWMWTDFRDLCGRILREGKAVQPELGLFCEDVSELAIPVMSTYWSRQFAEVETGALGGRGVGLFSYVYHDYITAIGAACVQGQGTGRPSARLRCRVLANNLCRGLIMGPFLQDVPLDPTDAWHREVSAAYLSYCRPYARFAEYLVLGRTVRPPAVDSDEVEAEYNPGQKSTVRLPAVDVGSFQAADGSAATVLANITPERRQATLHLNGAGQRSLYTADRQVERQWRDAGSAGAAVDLEPFGVRVLVCR